MLYYTYHMLIRKCFPKIKITSRMNCGTLKRFILVSICGVAKEMKEKVNLPCICKRSGWLCWTKDAQVKGDHQATKYNKKQQTTGGGICITVFHLDGYFTLCVANPTVFPNILREQENHWRIWPLLHPHDLRSVAFLRRFSFGKQFDSQRLVNCILFVVFWTLMMTFC